MVKILELFRCTHDVKLAGTHAVIGEAAHIFADVDVFFGDERALKEMFMLEQSLAVFAPTSAYTARWSSITFLRQCRPYLVPS